MFKDRLIKNAKTSFKSKEGAEIFQSLIIIGVIGAIAVIMVIAFKTQLYSSLGPKVRDETYDYSIEANQDIASILKSNGRFADKERIQYNK